MNFISKARFYWDYRKEVRGAEKELLSRYNMKVDMLGRLYTIYTVAETDLTQYGKDFAVGALKSYLNKVDAFLISRGIADLYGKLEEERLNDNQFRVVIGYRYFDAEKVANVLLRLATFAFIGLVAGGAFAAIYFFAKP